MDNSIHSASIEKCRSTRPLAKLEKEGPFSTTTSEGRIDRIRCNESFCPRHDCFVIRPERRLRTDIDNHIGPAILLTHCDPILSAVIANLHIWTADVLHHIMLSRRCNSKDGRSRGSGERQDHLTHTPGCPNENKLFPIRKTCQG